MIGSGLPSITCVTVTCGRTELLKRAISCYLKQSYYNKNLIIVSQASGQDNDLMREHIKSLYRPDISFFVASPDLSLGRMRNLSCELANGDIICQWDDDDLYHPDRLMSQYNVLRADSRRVASIYTQFLKYFMTTGELYWCDWSGEPIVSHRFLCGSIMFYKSLFATSAMFYPQDGSQSIVEEDLNVLEKLQLKGDLGYVRDGWQYVYVYHGSNVYDLRHHNLAINTKWGKKVLDKNELLERQSLLTGALSLLPIDRSIVVRSLDAHAFTFKC